MGLSLEKLFPESEASDNEWLQIELAESRLKLKADDKVGERLEECWPSFSFLKGMGFENVIFRTRDAQTIEDWAYRIESYEQNYIEDPEYLHVNELKWNEKDAEGVVLIECVPRSGARELIPGQSIRSDIPHVPPMQAPLGVSSASLKAFVDEARNYDSAETLSRIRLILQEYTREKNQMIEDSWFRILLGVIRVCLQERALEKALLISKEHPEDMAKILRDDDKATELFSLYEPKGNKIERWSQLFNSVSLERLVSLLESKDDSRLRSQVIRLLSNRVITEHEKLIQICLSAKPATQKILLPWLSNYWSPKNYRDILRSLKFSLEQPDFLDLIPHWVQALSKSYRQQALEDIKALFVPRKWFKFFKRTPPKLGRLQQLAMFEALSELRSAEVLQLLKEIKPYLRGEATDQVEKIIQSYRMNRSS